MTKGQWYRFVVYTKMSHTADSQTSNIKIWLNGTNVKDWNGDVGYNPNIDYYYKDGYYRENQKFDVFFGLYRGRQLTHSKLFFDQVKFGSTYTDADPDN